MDLFVVNAHPGFTVMLHAWRTDGDQLRDDDSVDRDNEPEYVSSVKFCRNDTCPSDAVKKFGK
jgi:hypothetical protein